MRAMTIGAAIAFLAVWSGVASAQEPARAAAMQQAMAFPVDARVAYVDIDRVAAVSAEGKAAIANLEALRAKRTADLEARRQTVDALQQKLTVDASVLDAAAAAALQREFQRAQIDFRRASEDARADIDYARQETMQAFSAKLFPIIGQVAKEKKVWAVFGSESGLLWHEPAIDLTEEVANRLDGVAHRK